MKARDVQKIFGSIHETVQGSLDHMADRFADAAANLGAEYDHLAEFSGTWKKLSKEARTVFVEQFLKSSALVIAGALATKAGLKLAGKSQKELRKMLVALAGLIDPALRKPRRKAEAKLKKGKKKAKKSGKRLAKSVA